MSTPDLEPVSNDATPHKPNPALERTLVFIVVILGIALLAGLAAVVLRIFYLSSRPAAQQAAATTTVTTPDLVVKATLPPEVKLALPEGAVVRSMSLSDERLAVHYDAPSGAGIAVVDVNTGNVVARVRIDGSAPAP